MSIRPMVVQDKPAVMHILQNTPEFNNLDLAVAEEVIDDYLKDASASGYHILVSAIDALIYGYVCYGLNPMTVSTWDIYWIAIARSSQGKGMGRELLTATENLIWKAGGTLIIIETSSTPLYDRTNRFYNLIGYKVACQIAEYYGPGDGKIIYEKRSRSL
jgi:ribosomal protein S18 acetylase RimI-like enzyme